MRQQFGSHPPASERAARLDAFHIGEYPPTSKLVRYAVNFFKDIIAYAETLDGAKLGEPLQCLR
jgi:hypothetical protein